MSSDGNDAEIEARLARYRPASPLPKLRDRMLGLAVAPQAPRLSLAAGLTIAGLLQWAAAQVDARTVLSMRGGENAPSTAAAEVAPALEALTQTYVQPRLPPRRPSRFHFRPVDVNEIL